MRLLFEMDKKDYENCTHSFVHNSASRIIISDKSLLESPTTSYFLDIQELIVSLYHKKGNHHIHHGNSICHTRVKQLRFLILTLLKILPVQY